MTITYPVSMPASPAPAMIRFTQRNTVGVSASPFTGQQQVYAHQGKWWEAEVSLPPMTRAQAEPWIAFFMSLRGREGTFLMGDPAGATARGVATGTPKVRYMSNLHQRSQELDNAYWTKSNCSVTANATTAPDGTTTADKLVENTATSIHALLRTINRESASDYTWSIYVKAAERAYCAMWLYSIATTADLLAARYNLTTGSLIASSDGGAATVKCAYTEDAGSGWWRCVLGGNFGNSDTQFRCDVAASADGVTATYLGDGSSGIYLWGAQAEEGVGAGSLAQTTTAAVSVAPSGLTLQTDGWTASSAILKAGDWLQIGSGAAQRLYRVVTDVTSNAGGVVPSVDIWPRLREVPADNAPITVASTKGVWRLATNEAGYEVHPASIYQGMTFVCSEAI